MHAETAERARDLLAAGMPVATLVREIPPLSRRSARTNIMHYDRVELDQALAERVLGPTNAEVIFSIPADGISGVLTVDEEHYLLVVDARIGSEQLGERTARRLAMREILLRERQDFLDRVLSP